MWHHLKGRSQRLLTPLMRFSRSLCSSSSSSSSHIQSSHSISCYWLYFLPDLLHILSGHTQPQLNAIWHPGCATTDLEASLIKCSRRWSTYCVQVDTRVSTSFFQQLQPNNARSAGERLTFGGKGLGQIWHWEFSTVFLILACLFLNAYGDILQVGKTKNCVFYGWCFPAPKGVMWSKDLWPELYFSKLNEW